MAASPVRHLVGYLRRTAAPAPAEDARLLDRVATGRDADAFAALVRRHGGLVRAACRRVLGDGPDADDAFQATFLVLWQNAARVRRRQAAGSWLFGVAHRVACRARTAAARRHRHEQNAAAATVHAVAEPPDLSWREACAALHEELDRLPDKYRLPLLLCYLGDKSRDEAAQALGWRLGVVKGRLERGREQLRRRLARRGIDLSVGLLAGSAGGAATASGVPVELVQTTVGAAAGGTSAPAVAALASGVARAMIISRVQFATLLVAAVLFAGAGFRLLAPATANPADPPTPAAKVPPADEGGEVTFRGRALDPDGKPLAGARVYLFVRRHVTEMPAFKDPQARLEEVTVKGVKQHRLAHPKLDAFLAKHKLDPFALDTLDPLTQREAIDELMAIHAEIFGNDPRITAPVRARSGADGRWEFRIARRQLQPPLHADVMLGAWVAGFGPAWFTPAEGETFADVPLKLAKDVPIEGRLIDINGQPVVGAKVKVKGVYPVDDRLALIQAAAQRNTTKYNELMFKQQYIGHHNASFHPKSATTGADGRFRIPGIGADRAVELHVQSDTAGNTEFTVLTRTEPGPKVATGPSSGFPDSLRTFGAKFNIVLNPTRVFVGSVRDKATGKPLVGAQVAAWGPTYIDTFTDRDGKYRLTGLAKARTYTVHAWPPRDEPYLVTTMEKDDPMGLEPLTFDFEVVRGMWLKGKLTDAATGRPVAQAQIVYAAQRDNPHVAAFAFPGNPAFPGGPNQRNVPRLVNTHTSTGTDGGFRVAVLPGRGLLAVMVNDGPYPPAKWTGRALRDTVVPADFFGDAEFYNFYHPLDIAEGPEPTALTLAMIPGRTVAGTVTDPDGKPLTGVVIYGLKAREFQPPEPLKTADFSVTGMAPGRERVLLAQHPARKLVAVLRVAGDAPGPLTLKLEPSGTVTGRILDAGTQSPLKRKSIMATFADQKLGMALAARTPATGTTDDDGRFRIEDLVPGQAYNLLLNEGTIVARAGTATVAAGETKNLGDVRVERPMLEP